MNPTEPFVAVALAGVAFWRSGGDADLQRAQEELRRDLDALRTKRREIVESAADALNAAYNRSRGELRAVQARIAELRRHTADGLQDQLQKAGNQAHARGRRPQRSPRSRCGCCSPCSVV